LNLENPSLGTYSLYLGDPCVQVSFDFVTRSSRIKVGKERFGHEQELGVVLGGPD
jgi:hypothetical protein